MADSFDISTVKHVEQTGDGGSPQGLAAANAAARALPGYVASQADGTFTLNVWMQRQNPTSTRAQAEEYYKVLPPLTRGHVVPVGYPLHRAGFDLEQTFFPFIVTAQPGDPKKMRLAWDKYGIPKVPDPQPMTLAQFVADRDTVAVQKDANGAPASWWNPRLFVFASYQPHLLFDALYRGKVKANGKALSVHANPAAPYWQNTYQAWTEPTYLQSLTVDAVVVVAAIAGAYALAPLNGTAAASAADLAPTTVDLAPPAAGDAGTIAPSTFTAGGATPIETVGAPTLAGAPVATSTVATAGSVLDAVKTAGSAIVKSVLGAAAGAAVANAIKPKTPAQTSGVAAPPASAAQPMSPGLKLALTAAGAFLLYALT